MSSSNNVEMGYRSLLPAQNTAPLIEEQTLSQISANLRDARFDPLQKMILIGSSEVPFQDLVDRVVKLRPNIRNMTWNGDYLTIARRITNMADGVEYRPKSSFWAWIENCCTCVFTVGCRERTIFKDGRLTEEELDNRQFWAEYYDDMPPG